MRIVIFLFLYSLRLFADNPFDPSGKFRIERSPEEEKQAREEFNRCSAGTGVYIVETGKCVPFSELSFKVIPETPEDIERRKKEKEEARVREIKSNFRTQIHLYDLLSESDDPKLRQFKFFIKSLPISYEQILNEVLESYLETISTNDDIDYIVNGYLNSCFSDFPGNELLEMIIKKDFEMILRKADDLPEVI